LASTKPNFINDREMKKHVLKCKMQRNITLHWSKRSEQITRSVKTNTKIKEKGVQRNYKGLIRKFTDLGYTNKKWYTHQFLAHIWNPQSLSSSLVQPKPSLFEYSKMTTVPTSTSTVKLQTAELMMKFEAMSTQPISQRRELAKEYKVGIQARETTRDEIMKTSRNTIWETLVSIESNFLEKMPKSRWSCCTTEACCSKSSKTNVMEGWRFGVKGLGLH